MIQRVGTILLLCLLLVACAAPGADPGAGTDATSSTAGAGEDAVVEIDFYYPTAVGGPIADVFNGYAEAFNAANPGIHVNTTYAGSYDDIAAAVQTEIQGAGAGPDVAVMLSIDLHTFKDNGYIIPLQDFINGMPDADTYTDDFFSAFMENSVTADGMVWSLPFQRSTPVLYYNKDLFSEVGLDPEMPPQNRAELIEYGQQLTLPNGERSGILIPSSGFPYWLFQSFAIANGQNVIGAGPAEVYFDHPAVISALEDFVGLIEAGVMPEGEIVWGDTPSDFINGNTAMIYHTTGSLTNILGNAEFEVGVANLVAGDVGFGAPTGGGNLYMFSSSSPEEQAAAWEWIQYLSSTEVQADWGVATGYIAARQSAWETEALQSLVAEKPQYEVALNQLPYAKKEISTHQGVDIRAIFNQAISRTIAGEMSAADALAIAQEEADALLAPYAE